MGEIGKEIIGLEHAPAFGGRALGGQQHMAGLVQQGRVFLAQRVGAAVLGLGEVPFGAQRVAGLDRLPGRLGDHGRAVGQADHVDHPGHRPRGRVVERFQRPAEAGAAQADAMGHVLQPHIHAEHVHRAVDLAFHVHPREGLADIDPAIGGLGRDLFGDGFGGGQRGHLAEGRGVFARDEAPGLDRHGGRLHPPFAGGGGDQHRAGGRAGLAILLPGIGHRGRAAGPLHAQQRVGVKRGVGGRELGRDLRDRGVKLVRDQRRKAGRAALPLVEMLDDDDHAVVGRDVHEGRRKPLGGRHRAGRGGGGLRPGARRRQQCPQQQPARRAARQLEKAAPAGRGRALRRGAGRARDPVQHFSPP